jgi:hypothetical protein
MPVVLLSIVVSEGPFERSGRASKVEYLLSDYMFDNVQCCLWANSSPLFLPKTDHGLLPQAFNAPFNRLRCEPGALPDEGR